MQKKTGTEQEKIKWTTEMHSWVKKLKNKNVLILQFKNASFLSWCSILPDICTSKIYFKYTGVIMEAHDLMLQLINPTKYI